ncbi:hypothetical protein OQA88_11639 [Cercophora sp. LCS_1]
MSGMEPLAALGLACNVIQLISFCGEVLSVLKAVKSGGSIDPSAAIAAQLTAASDAVSQSLTAVPKALDADETEILDIAKECLAAADNLTAKLEEIRGNGTSSGSYRAGLTRAVKKMWNKREIEELESMLTQTEALSIEQDSGFAHLGSTLCHLIETVAAGEARLTSLVNQQSRDVNEHVTHCTSELRELVLSEGIQTRRELTTRIEEAISSHQHEAKRRSLIESLRYEGMNDRYSQITMPHQRTFHWIFGPGQEKRGTGSKTETPDDDGDEDEDSDNYDGDDSEDYDSDDTDSQSLRCWAADEPLVFQASKTFLDWLHSRGPALYWVSGKVGSGKSTFMRFLVEDPRTRAGLGSTTLLHHFFWASGQPMERRIEGMYCSLLRQLLLIQPELAMAVSDTVPPNRPKKSPRDWSIKELHDAMHAAALASPQPVCMFVDGIDEVDRDQGLDEILDELEGYLSVPQLRICIASRPEPAIKLRLSKYPALHLQDLTSGDIKRYAWEKLRPYFKHDSPDLRSLAKRVGEKSDGVFLWVSLAVKSLQQYAYGDSIVELQERIDRLSGSLYPLFNTLWQSLNGDKAAYRKECARLLKLVLLGVGNGKGSLSLWGTQSEECQVSLFVLALAQDPRLRGKVLHKDYCPSRTEWLDTIKLARKRLEARCAYLLEEKRCVVRLVHRSATEFLEATPDGQRILSHDDSTSEDCLADLMCAEIAVARLTLIHQVLTPLWQPPTLDNIVRRLCQLCHQGHLPAARALQLMDHVEDICSTTSWRLPRATRSRGPLDLDLLGEAVASGFLEFVAPALAKLEASAPNGSVSPAYRCYLITTACVCGDIAGPAVETSAPRTAEIVGLLTSRWTDMGRWGYHYTKDDRESYMVPCTPMMALCRFALSGGSPDVFCSALENMLRHGTGGDLQDITTFMIEEERLVKGSNTDDADSDSDSDREADNDTYAIRMHSFHLDVLLSFITRVLVEANVAYIIDIILRLYQGLAQEHGLSAEIIQRLTAILTSCSIPKKAKD